MLRALSAARLVILLQTVTARRHFRTERVVNSSGGREHDGTRRCYHRVFRLAIVRLEFLI